MKWKIGLVVYCCLILWVSSLAPKELPDQAMAVPDYILHFVEYCLLGVLAWAAFGGGGGFPWGLFAFCYVLESQMNAGRTGGRKGGRPRYGMRRPMLVVLLLACFVRWFFGEDS